MQTSERSAAKAQTRPWLYEIERLKGFAIILVVWGHVYHADLPALALTLRAFIYSFHMPLFMFISGYIFMHAGNPLQRMNILHYIIKRFRRLILPFIVMAVIIIAGKLLFQTFIEVRSPVNNLTDALSSLFLHTEDSPVFFIWYLVVVFYFSVLLCFLIFKKGLSALQILISSLALYAIYIALYQNNVVLDYLYFNRFMMYLSSFALGVYSYQVRETLNPVVDKYWPALAAAFLIVAYFLIESEWRYLAVGSIACMVFLGICRSPFFGRLHALDFIGKYVFAIYLLNMPFVGLTQGLMTRLFPAYSHGYLLIVICILVGLSGPIAIKITLDQFRLLRPLTRAME